MFHDVFACLMVLTLFVFVSVAAADKENTQRSKAEAQSDPSAPSEADDDDAEDSDSAGSRPSVTSVQRRAAAKKARTGAHRAGAGDQSVAADPRVKNPQWARRTKGKVLSYRAQQVSHQLQDA